jgi:hypothetical protein
MAGPTPDEWAAILAWLSAKPGRGLQVEADSVSAGEFHWAAGDWIDNGPSGTWTEVARWFSRSAKEAKP